MESWRLVGGVGALTDRLRTRIPAHLVACNHTVQEVADRGQGLRVSAQTPHGSAVYLAQQAIITLPPRLVANTLRFVPALPADVVAALRETQTWMGQAMKALLVYDRPFWRDVGLSGLGVSYVGPVAQFHDASPADGAVGALFGWLGNHSPGRGLSPAERQAAILAQATRMYGPQAAALLTYADHNWARDRFTTAPAGELMAEEEHPRYGDSRLQPPQMGGRLHWAGTETSPVNGGYLDGAVYSGKRIAQRLLR